MGQVDWSGLGYGQVVGTWENCNHLLRSQEGFCSVELAS
jgi:hypothetical protein